MEKTLERNLQLLHEYNQHLLPLLEESAVNPVESLSVGQERIFKLVDDEGREFYSGSLYDPVYEANIFLQDVNFDNTGYILMGLPSSAMLKVILERKTTSAWVFVIEPNVQLVKAFLEQVDLADFLDPDMQRLVFFTGEESLIKTSLATYMNSLVGYYFMQTEVLRTFPSLRCQKEVYDRVFDYLLDFIKLNVTNIGNSLEDTLMGIRNELKNLKHILTRKPFRHLQDVYKDVPMICVASGPSLDKQLPLLKEVKGKAIIISAESAFRVLLKNGIEPDILCILERGTPSYELSLAGIEIPPTTALVGLSLIDSRIYDTWNKYAVPNFKSNNANSRMLNRTFENEFGEMYSGSSVAHMNLSLARFMGGNPIVLIGQDLAYSDSGMTHSKDSFYVEEEQAGISRERVQSIKKSLENEKNDHNQTIYLDGYYGGKVKSRSLWGQFKLWMEHLIDYLPGGTVINATEGGARIAGTKQMPFREVVDTYCTKVVKPITATIDEMSDPAHEPKYYLQLLLDRLEERRHKYEEIRGLTEANRLNLRQLWEDIEAGRLELVEVKAARVLRNTETLIRTLLEDQHFSFYFRPLIANLHIKSNPISRISTMDRLQEILKHQDFFMRRVQLADHDIMQTYQKGFESVIEEFGFTLDDFEHTGFSGEYEHEVETEGGDW